MDICLYKDGTYGDFKPKKKYKNLDKMKAIFVDIHSDILGNFYRALSPKTYKKWDTKIEKVKLSWSFCNGVNTNEYEEMEDELSVEYSSEFNSLARFLSKVSEIVYAENVLHDLLWIRESFMCYYFHKLRIKVKFKNKSKYKKMEYDDFMNYMGLWDNDTRFKNGLRLNKQKETYKIIEKHGKSKINMLHLGDYFYIPLSNKIFDFSKIEIKHNSYVSEYDEDMEDLSEEELEEEYLFASSSNMISPLTKVSSYLYLFEYPMVQFILNEILDAQYMAYMIKSKLKVTNIKGKKEKFKFRKFNDLIFPKRYS